MRVDGLCRVVCRHLHLVQDVGSGNQRGGGGKFFPARRVAPAVEGLRAVYRAEACRWSLAVKPATASGTTHFERSQFCNEGANGGANAGK